MSDASRSYDRYQRDPESTRFYNSSVWKAARKLKATSNPICERCGLTTVEHVHHIIPLKKCTPEQRTAQSNLKSLCIPCHNAEEAEAAKGSTPVVRGTLKIDDRGGRYRFDEAKADRVVRFIQNICRHYEGRFAGQPFTLLDWQRDEIVRPLFGWLDADTGLRRFRELYLISAKGAGKTPLLAAIGLYCLLADEEPGAHVVSMASTFEQANLTFDAGKKFIAECPQLARHKSIDVTQYAIKAPQHSKWTTISGKPTGRSGPRPSCIIADEAHEWGHATAQGFDLLCANLFKRSQPLRLIATNAAASRNCYAWSLHERAMRVLSEQEDDPTLLPLIYEADAALDWRSEDAARQANPSLGKIVSFDQVRPEQSKGEARYRRLYLSQWVTGSRRWLDLDAWDAASSAAWPDEKTLATLPCYLGLDWSKGDDLCAIVYVYVAPDRHYVRSRFWLPRKTADEYQRSHGLAFDRWAEAKAITLLKEQTINADVHARIAAELIAEHKANPFARVCYDRAYADHIIAALDAARVPLEKIGQGWGVSSGSAELERRLKDGSITIALSPVMRWNAENVEVKHDERGNCWPVKPGAKGKYAGTRSAKIDGISALVTALTVARTHAFPRHQQTSNAQAWLV